jgi:hypothetical protein
MGAFAEFKRGIPESLVGAFMRAPVLAWVGRAIRRVEDPALLAGHGRFTADLPPGLRAAKGRINQS